MHRFLLEALRLEDQVWIFVVRRSAVAGTSVEIYRGMIDCFGEEVS
jgi:hypothetical protein